MGRGRAHGTRGAIKMPGARFSPWTQKSYLCCLLGDVLTKLAMAYNWIPLVAYSSPTSGVLVV